MIKGGDEPITLCLLALCDVLQTKSGDRGMGMLYLFSVWIESKKSATGRQEVGSGATGWNLPHSGTLSGRKSHREIYTESKSRGGPSIPETASISARS